MTIVYEAGAGGVTVADICRRLDQLGEKVRTVQAVGALMSSIRDKGYVLVEVEGLAHRYYPAIPYRDAVAPIVEEFLETVLRFNSEALSLLQARLDERLAPASKSVKS